MTQQMVVAITGGGAKWVGDYLSKGGRSSHFLEAIVPYSGEALDQFIGRRPDKYCSAETASMMAMRSYERVGKLNPGSQLDDRIGVGVTASLYKSEQRVGRVNQVFIATQTLDYSTVATYQLHDENREQQEHWASRLIGSELLLDWDAPLKYLPPEHVSFKDRERMAPGRLMPVYDGTSSFEYWGDAPKKQGPGIVFSSSCNPFHDGHRAMIDYARAMFLDANLYCELSVKNFEKPTIDYISLDKRLKTIPEGLFDNTIVSNLSHFADKAKAMPGTMFAIGADTLNRINWNVDRHVFAATGCRLLVFPRMYVEIQDKSRMYDKLVSFAYNFEPSALSSTEIRRVVNF